MASNSYLRRKSTSTPASTGKQIYLNINSISRVKGTPTTDLPLPSETSSNRQLLPLSGQRNDFTLNCSLLTESSNNAYDVSTGGSLTPNSPTITSIKDQYNYLFDTLMSENINTTYQIYIDWLDKTFEGTILLNSDALKEDFTGEVIFTIEFKEGSNFLFIG